MTAIATAEPVLDEAGESPATGFPPRPVAVSWPTTCQDRSQVMRLVESASSTLPKTRVEKSSMLSPSRVGTVSTAIWLPVACS